MSKYSYQARFMATVPPLSLELSREVAHSGCRSIPRPPSSHALQVLRTEPSFRSQVVVVHRARRSTPDDSHNIKLGDFDPVEKLGPRNACQQRGEEKPYRRMFAMQGS